MATVGPYLNNYFKRKQIKFSNKKIKNGRVDLKKKRKGANDMLPTDTHFRFKDTHRLKVKKWKKIFQAKSNSPQKGQLYLYHRKINFKLNVVKRDKNGSI